MGSHKVTTNPRLVTPAHGPDALASRQLARTRGTPPCTMTRIRPVLTPVLKFNLTYSPEGLILTVAYEEPPPWSSRSSRRKNVPPGASRYGCRFQSIIRATPGRPCQRRRAMLALAAFVFIWSH